MRTLIKLSLPLTSGFCPKIICKLVKIKIATKVVDSFILQVYFTLTNKMNFSVLKHGL